MAKVEIRSWYLMRTSEDATVVYLVPARSLEDAVQQFGILAQGKEVKAITWAELEELVGVIIPATSVPSEQAVGSVTLLHKNKVVSFWVYK